MLWVCNLISPDSLTSRTIAKNGYLIKNKDGRPVIAEWWNGYSTILDLTNEAAVEWFKGQHNHLMLEYGYESKAEY